MYYVWIPFQLLVSCCDFIIFNNFIDITKQLTLAGVKYTPEVQNMYACRITSLSAGGYTILVH